MDSEPLAALPPDAVVAAALCHEIYQPLSCLLASLEHAQHALRRRPPSPMDQPALRLARWLADAHATANHIARVVSDVHGHARQEPRRLHRFDLRGAVRAAAAMAQPGGDASTDAEIIVDAAEPFLVEGIDTRLVHVFLELFAEALREETHLLVRLARAGRDIVVELRCATARTEPTPPPPRRTREGVSPALDRAVVRHIVAAHGGRLELWPAAGASVLARVTLPAAGRSSEEAPEA